MTFVLIAGLSMWTAVAGLLGMAAYPNDPDRTQGKTQPGGRLDAGVSAPIPEANATPAQ